MQLLTNRHMGWYKTFRVLLAIGLVVNPLMFLNNWSLSASTYGMTMSDYFALAPLHMGFFLVILAIDEVLFAMLLYYLVRYDEKAVRHCIIMIAFPLIACCITLVTDAALITYELSSALFRNFLARCIYYIPNYFYFKHRLLPDGAVHSKPTPDPAPPPSRKCMNCEAQIPFPDYQTTSLCPKCTAFAQGLPEPSSVYVSAAPASSPKKQLTIDQVIARQKNLPLTQANPSPSAIEPPPCAINCASCGAMIDFPADGAPGLCSVCLAKRRAFEALRKEEDETPIADETIERPQFCRKCGTKLHADSLFCDKCGEKILTESES